MGRRSSPRLQVVTPAERRPERRYGTPCDRHTAKCGRCCLRAGVAVRDDTVGEAVADAALSDGWRFRGAAGTETPPYGSVVAYGRAWRFAMTPYPGGSGCVGFGRGGGFGARRTELPALLGGYLVLFVDLCEL